MRVVLLHVQGPITSMFSLSSSLCLFLGLWILTLLDLAVTCSPEEISFTLWKKEHTNI